MNTTRTVFLFLSLVLWATLIGGITYAHLVFLRPYLHHLPASTSLLEGPFAIREERFWLMIHPLLILSLVITNLLNWRLPERRKFLLYATGMYAVIIILTFSFFVPELQDFAASATSRLPAESWVERGVRWEKLSWIRGAFMYFGFILLLVSLTKAGVQEKLTQPKQKRQRSLVSQS